MKIFEMTAHILWTTWLLLPLGVYTLKASMGLYTTKSQKVEISSNSVFVGKEENSLIHQLWCHGDDSWDICTWIWKDNQYCKYIQANPSVRQCSNNLDRIDRTGNDCNLEVSSLLKAKHEGQWSCRLSKYNKFTHTHTHTHTHIIRIVY